MEFTVLRAISRDTAYGQVHRLCKRIKILGRLIIRLFIKPPPGKCNLYCVHFGGIPWTCWYCTRNSNHLKPLLFRRRAYEIKDYYEDERLKKEAGNEKDVV